MNKNVLPPIVDYSQLLGAGSRWSIEEEYLLYLQTVAGKTTEEISALHERSRAGIFSRQVNLQLRKDRKSDLVNPLPEFIPSTKLSLEVIKHDWKMQKTSEPFSKVDEPNVELDDFKDEVKLKKLSEKQILLDPIEALWNAIKSDTIKLKAKRNKLREVKVLVARLDPDPLGGKIRTLRDLGKELSVSAERIRQVFHKGKRKLVSKVRGKELGRVIKIINENYDLHNKTKSQILAWYYQLLIRNKCAEEFASIIFSALRHIHSIDLTKIKVATEDYRESLLKLKRYEKVEDKKIILDKRVIKKADKFVLSVLNKSLFAGSFAKKLDDLSIFKPLRTVERERTFFSESLRKLVQWESYGELKFIKALEASSIIKEFVEQPLEIEYQLNGKKIYVPDFLVRTEEDLVFVLEVKNRKQLADTTVLAKARAATKYLGKKGVGYCLVEDRDGLSIDDLKKVIVPENVKSFLRGTLKSKGLVEFADLYKHFGERPDNIIFDQMQSLALNHPKKIRYDTKLIPNKNNSKRKHFVFEFKLI